jgi:predicted NBD/HSP70 family sugar kinase
MAQKDSVSIISSRQRFRRNRVLALIRAQAGISRFDLKKITSYSIETIQSITAQLLKDKLIYEKESDGSGTGRKPVSLFIAPDGGYCIGIEFNCRRIQGMLINFTEEKIAGETELVNLNDDADALLAKLENMIDKLLSALPEHARMLGIGIGTPGFFDPETGTVISYDFLPAWKNIPLKKIIEERFGIPCYMENNVSTIAIAYRWLTWQSTFPKEPEDFLFVSIRTGVQLVPCYGGRFIFAGKSYVGQLGHIKVPGSNRLCACGERGCLNAEVSDPGIHNKMVELRLNHRLEKFHGSPDELNTDTLKTLVEQGDEDAIELVKDSALKLGSSLGVMLDILAPDLIVLSGKLTALGSLFMDAVAEGIRENSINRNASRLKLAASTMSDSAGAWGAAVLALLRVFDFKVFNV